MIDNTGEETSIDMEQAFRDQEMRVEHTINIIRGWGAGIIGIVNIAFFGIYQGMFELNFTVLLAIFAGVFIFFGYIWFVHRLSRPGQYHAWLKYLTITVDYILLVGKFAVLGAEKLMAHFISYAIPEQSGVDSFMEMTSGRVIIFMFFITFSAPCGMAGASFYTVLSLQSSAAVWCWHRQTWENIPSTTPPSWSFFPVS